MNLTIVTAIYDLGRGGINDSFKRPYTHYLERFKELVDSIDIPIVVFCDVKDRPFMERIKTSNLYIIEKNLEDFKHWFEFYPEVQKIRKKSTWLKQADWLKESPQATLEFYNPLVMSKMFLLNDITFINPFQTEYFLWLDAGLTSTVHSGYFSHDKILDKILLFLKPFLFLSYPYEGHNEIHGFERSALHSLARVEPATFVCRGGLFGGTKDAINNLNAIYYNLLKKSLQEGYMGTEESIFTIMAYLYPTQMNRFMLGDHGMIGTFCEALKDGTVKLEEPLAIGKALKEKIKAKVASNKEVSVYVLTYNFTDQFKMLLDSFSDQPDFLVNSRCICVDNSTDLQAATEIENLCKEFDFEYIKQDNLGICGGRKFVAKHFQDSEQSYYIFFEDDMLLQRKGALPCRNGLVTFVPDLYDKILQIMKIEQFDYLKLSFTEFYMDNSVAVPWYNVPQDVREILYPEQKIKTNEAIVPSTKFDRISNVLGLSYITGDIFFCNWPTIITKEGNYKIFFEPEYQYPYEQTIMSHVHQRIAKKEIKPAVLLASVINHERIFHYDASLRKEC
jgi:hypothetical protein